MPGRTGPVLLVAMLPGAPGASQGPSVPAWPAGAPGLEIVSVSSGFSCADSKSVATVCPAGKTALGGGAFIRTADTTHDVVLQASYPSAADTWTAKGIETKPLSEKRRPGGGAGGSPGRGKLRGYPTASGAVSS